MIQIYENLYQNSQYRDDVNIAVHQYLLDTSCPALIHAGSANAAADMIPRIEEILGGRALRYVFVSHLGADECGGLSVLAQKWPEMEAVVSAHTARELPGFGINCKLRVVKSGDHIKGEDHDFQIIDYPSEPHLDSGILVYEAVSGIFFSSDLMLRAGEGAGKIVTSVWQDEIHATGLRQVPSKSLLRTLRHDLEQIDPKFIAVGHGFCMRLKKYD